MRETFRQPRMPLKNNRARAEPGAGLGGIDLDVLRYCTCLMRRIMPVTRMAGA